MLSKNKILLAALLGQTIISAQAFSMDDDGNGAMVPAKPKAQPKNRQAIIAPHSNLDLVGRHQASKIINLAQLSQDDKERAIRTALIDVRDLNTILDRRLDNSIYRANGSSYEYELIPAALRLYQKNEDTVDTSAYISHTDDSSYNYSHDYTGSSTYYKGGKPGWTFCGIISGGGTGETLNVTAPRSHSSESKTSHSTHNEKQSLSLNIKREYSIEILPGKLTFKVTASKSDKNANDSHYSQQNQQNFITKPQEPRYGSSHLEPKKLTFSQSHNRAAEKVANPSRNKPHGEFLSGSHSLEKGNYLIVSAKFPDGFLSCTGTETGQGKLAQVLMGQKYEEHRAFYQPEGKWRNSAVWQVTPVNNGYTLTNREDFLATSGKKSNDGRFTQVLGKSYYEQNKTSYEPEGRWRSSIVWHIVGTENGYTIENSSQAGALLTCSREQSGHGLFAQILDGDYYQSNKALFQPAREERSKIIWKFIRQ